MRGRLVRSVLLGVAGNEGIEAAAVRSEGGKLGSGGPSAQHPVPQQLGLIVDGQQTNTVLGTSVRLSDWRCHSRVTSGGIVTFDITPMYLAQPEYICCGRPICNGWFLGGDRLAAGAGAQTDRRARGGGPQPGRGVLTVAWSVLKDV